MSLIFDEPVSLKLLENECKSMIANYRFRIYEIKDDTTFHMLEIGNESDIKFLYRLKLTHTKFERIRNDNDLKVDNDKLIPYIKKFIGDIKSGNQWLQCSFNENQCNLQFTQETELAARCMLKLPFTAVNDKELIDYVIGKCETYKKKYREIKEDSERKKKKNESLEKEIKGLKNVDEKNKELERKIENLEEDINGLKLDLESAKEKYEEERDINIGLREDNDALQKEFDELQKDYDDVDEEADRLKQLQDDAEQLAEELQEKYDELYLAFQIIVDKARKREELARKLEKENIELQHDLKYCRKKLQKEHQQIVTLELGIKSRDEEIQKLNIQVEQYKEELTVKEKLLHEIRNPPPQQQPLLNAPTLPQPTKRQTLCSNRTGNSARH